MKVVILAAGKGTRMLPLTENKPKVLVEVKGKPFLFYVLENLKQAGFTKIGIVVGYKKEQIVDFLKKINFQTTLIEQKEQLGTGHALLQAKSFCGSDPFLVLGGDNLWSVRDLKLMNRKDEFNYLSGIEVQDPTKYGVLSAKTGFLQEIKEKPLHPQSDLVNTGLYKFTPEIWFALSKVGKSKRGEIELTDAVNFLAKEGKVKVVKVRDFWLDLGCPKDIKKIELFLRGNKKVKYNV